MSTKAGIRYVPDHEGSRDRSLCLVAPLWPLLDSFPIEARRELVSWAMADGELLRVLCNQIASSNDTDAECGGLPAADYWLSSQDRTALRSALLPLMPAAVADELAAALDLAKRNEQGASTLRSLIHVKLLMEREINRDDPSADACRSRREQYDEMWASAMRWYDSVGGPRP